MTVIAPIFPPKENPIIVTEKSKAIRITLNGTFGKCPEIIIGMASYGAVPISTSIYKAAVRMNSITDGISTAIRTGSVVKKSIPANVVAVGVPCRVLREITEEDRQYYYRDRAFDVEDYR